MNDKVFAAMSGGVDSSAAACLLAEAGLTVTGATMKLLCSDEADRDAKDARAVCEKLGIPHEVIDFTGEFRRVVIGNFADEYSAGRTPNPCVICNKYLKFGALLRAAEAAGHDRIATGHFARIDRDANGRYLLKRAVDETKDQSYMLWMLDQEQLSRTLLPLGAMRKTEVRAIAADRGLVTAHKSDSQDICFVPDGDYAGFLIRKTGAVPIPGDFVDSEGHVLGKHRGLIHYTVGQRKGLGIALGQPMFVASKDPDTRRVVLCGGDSPLLFRRVVTLSHLNLIAADRLDGPVRCEAKLRYRHNAAPAVLYQTGEDSAVLTFDTEQRAPAPGQSAVFYDGDTVIGGGLIDA
ncbi:MAG: tRNA 2-thiouridine(34) synthase MnmA [Clostridia bacterium]|nr:tRNA 2-thiouridine(34) synthase MnmA [Clostridia bacterium]